MLGPEMEVHRALGDFRVGENVVKADQAVRLARELPRSRAEDLQPRGVRSSVELLGQFRTSESGPWRRRTGNSGFRKLINARFFHLPPITGRHKRRRAGLAAHTRQRSSLLRPTPGFGAK
jgi:hypothetical protein